jgi:hypothetical protein
MLKYDKEDGYKVDGLTKKQERLIDALPSMERSGRKKMASQRWQRTWRSISVLAKVLQTR